MVVRRSDGFAEKPGVVLLDEYVVSGASETAITISSIAQTYRNLRLVFTGATSNAAVQGLILRINGDSGANYDWQRLRSTGTTTVSDELLGATSLQVGEVPSTSIGAYASHLVVDLPDYTGAFFKGTVATAHTVRSTASGGTRIETTVGTWESTAAITTVALSCGGANFAVGSVVSLYGLG